MLNVTSTEEIKTERLLLRRFRTEDIASAFGNWAGDEETQTGYGEPVYETIEKTRELIEGYIEKYKQPDYFRWAVILPESGECVGQIAFYHVESSNELGEIEYCIGKEYRNKGYTTEAVKALLREGFGKIGFNRIQISCRDNNPASRRVIEKSGFVYEGTLRGYFHTRDGYHDRLYFSLLAREFSE